MILKKVIKNMEKLIINFHSFFNITNVQTGKSFFFTLIFVLGLIFSIYIKNQKLIKVCVVGLLLSIIALYHHFNKYDIWKKLKKL